MAFLRRMPVLFLKFFWLSCFFRDRPPQESFPALPRNLGESREFLSGPSLSNLIKAPTAAFFKQ
ncbi:hypothetical protein CLOLEP_01512 [[Clostridium] leptum DSM 753]|uniref:Uncharacterized protein n=1 Tax=[Clostridium] leptum DSM 753 TaxID=428125 RepID=A7VSH1_9FIRM|nr:hypothetical protein CLOLEP_01512 [[Clostridium] leptum DSM 753]